MSSAPAALLDRHLIFFGHGGVPTIAYDPQPLSGARSALAVKKTPVPAP